MTFFVGSAFLRAASSLPTIENPLFRMSPKRHPTLFSGGDRKALNKEFRMARGMTRILADQAAEMRMRAEAMMRQADKLSGESWNERIWADGEPIDPSPTIDHAIVRLWI